ncbi:MAG TPA: efflux RND transporter periplasmic adaptor subunit [Thermoanaerobaculaceae bacterium]|nr:efflux RND transporter periplasmic adaptor subunit [Thermoanaerobaculaceae bacterium]
MKRITAGIGIVSLIGLGCAGDAARRSETPAAVSARLGRAELVEVPQRVELYGTVEPERQAAVSSRVMAVVTAVRIRAGESVAAGQVLVEIDPQTARGQEAQARGALAQAQAALALAARNLERYTALAAKGAASELELDMARMQHDQASGAVEQAQGAVDAAASVARESRVVAPFAGRIAAKLADVGDLAVPGRPLVMVESGTGSRLALAVPESAFAAANLRVGGVLPVRIDALGGDETSGAIEEIAAGADPMTHSFTIRVRLPGHDVPSGMAGRGWLALGSRRVVAVPARAVLASGGVSMVAVRDDTGRARTRAVVTGATLPGDRLEVLSGLRGGEDVLVGAAAPIADGATVEEVRQ